MRRLAVAALAAATAAAGCGDDEAPDPLAAVPGRPGLAGRPPDRLPKGEGGRVSVVRWGVSPDRTRVPIILRNGVGKAVQRPRVRGTALVGGRAVATGESQLIGPDAIAPGAIAVGFVFFRQPLPDGVDVRFGLEQGEGDPPGVTALDLPVVEVRMEGAAAVGVVRGDGRLSSGFVTLTALCTDEAGTPLDARTGPTAEAPLKPGEERPFSIALDGRCTRVLAVGQGVAIQGRT